MAQDFINSYYGFNPPFFGGHQKVLSRQSGERLIKNDLLQLIMTSPGERVMRPNWGTIVKKSLFELPTEDTLFAIKININQAIQTYETRVSVQTTVSFDPEQNTLTILLIGTYTNNPNVQFEQEIALPLRTTGG